MQVEDAVKVGEVGSRRVLEGLMGRNVGLKSFILDRTDIESIWFKELGEFFSVSVSGEVREVRDALTLIKRLATCIGGFSPGNA